MASFFIPLTGLNADSTALNTIANDLANMNTTAYKGQTTNFSDLFYQQVGTSGSGNEIQVGEGVQVASNETNFAQGSYDTSGTTSSDVALDGSGFFVVNNGGSNLYTRDGAFTQDSTGNLITADGMAVMGYPAVNGVVDTNSALTAINIPLSGQVQQPEATTTFSMTANLDSASPVGATFPAPITLYDSLGVSYQATVNYTKTGTNTWSYNITVPDTVPATEAAGAISYNLASSGGNTAPIDAATNLTITGLTAGGSVATTVAPTVVAGESLVTYAADLTTALSNAGIAGVAVSTTAGGELSITGANISTSGNVVQEALASANASGSLTFNSSGNLVSPAANISGITFSGLSDGAAVLNMTWDIVGANGTPTISQEDSASGLSAAPANGYAAGVYQGFTIGSVGTVTATYSNGQSQAVGQLALANVTNLQGLSLQGNGDYATTQASGAASIGVSGTGGLGTIEDSSLEESNVNISAEFSDLIIAQRAFEANAKSITTFDTVTQDTINMVH
jgi:flagellar hook protein FlgE